MKELITLAQDNVPWIATTLMIVSLFVEFTPIKINPLSWMFKTLKEKVVEDIHKENQQIHKENEQIHQECEDIHKEYEDINKRLDTVVYIKSKHYDEIVEGLSNMNKKLDSLYETIDENETDRLRCEILSFSASIRNGEVHDQEEYHQIIKANDKYHAIIEKRGFVNGVIDTNMAYILDNYKKHLERNDF